jgi:hypothetical protein
MLGSINLQNIKQLLMQSLNWTLATGNNESETDPLFLFLFQTEKDWIECQMIGIEEEIEHDLELSKMDQEEENISFLSLLLVAERKNDRTL